MTTGPHPAELALAFTPEEARWLRSGRKTLHVVPVDAPRREGVAPVEVYPDWGARGAYMIVSARYRPHGRGVVEYGFMSPLGGPAVEGAPATTILVLEDAYVWPRAMAVRAAGKAARLPADTRRVVSPRGVEYVVAYAADGLTSAHTTLGRVLLRGVTPAAKLPRWAARTRLRVTEMAVVSLDQATDDDAREMGYAPHEGPDAHHCLCHGLDRRYLCTLYQDWDERHPGRFASSTNPLCWAVTVKRTTRRGAP